MMQLKRVLFIAKYAIKNGYNIPILSASFRTDWILWEEKRKKNIAASKYRGINVMKLKSHKKA